VAAAKKLLVQDLQDLRQIMHEVQTENGDVKQMDELMLSQQDSPPASVGTVDVTKEKMEDLEVDILQEQIQSIRSTHAAQLRMDQNIAQEELAQLRAQYEEKTDRIGSNGTTTDESSLPPSSRSLWQRLKRPFRKR
jgi:conjugal transfer/entry exclusion protein